MSVWKLMKSAKQKKNTRMHWCYLTRNVIQKY